MATVGPMTNRYDIAATFTDLPCVPGALERIADNLMSDLLGLAELEPDILDPSVGVGFSDRKLDLAATVRAHEPLAAIRTFLSGLRSTPHGVGIAKDGGDVSIRATPQRSTVSGILDRAGKRSGGAMPLEVTTELIRADRDAA